MMMILLYNGYENILVMLNLCLCVGVFVEDSGVIDFEEILYVNRLFCVGICLDERWWLINGLFVFDDGVFVFFVGSGINFMCYFVYFCFGVYGVDYVDYGMVVVQ